MHSAKKKLHRELKQGGGRQKTKTKKKKKGEKNPVDLITTLSALCLFNTTTQIPLHQFVPNFYGKKRKETGKIKEKQIRCKVESGKGGIETVEIDKQKERWCPMYMLPGQQSHNAGPDGSGDADSDAAGGGTAVATAASSLTPS